MRSGRRRLRQPLIDLACCCRAHLFRRVWYTLPVERVEFDHPVPPVRGIKCSEPRVAVDPVAVGEPGGLHMLFDRSLGPPKFNEAAGIFMFFGHSAGRLGNRPRRGAAGSLIAKPPAERSFLLHAYDARFTLLSVLEACFQEAKRVIVEAAGLVMIHFALSLRVCMHEHSALHELETLS
mmetsp:Transcript_1660/g.3376  ORF Transcript_1660/g.3376 Transcript_1660/m.3376 type:complete len:179 (-) Transcript_1660:514-1050(-)